MFVCRMRAGDTRAHDHLMQHIMPEVRRSVRQVAHGDEDLFQEAGLAAYLWLRDEYTLGGPWVIKARLFGRRGIVPSLARKSRKTSVEVELPEDLVAADASAEDLTYWQEILEIVAKMSKSDRGVLEDYMLGGKDRKFRTLRPLALRKLATLLEIPCPIEGNSRRRKVWAEGKITSGLTQNEMRDIVQHLNDGISKTDLSWAYGVNPQMLRGITYHGSDD